MSVENGPFAIHPTGESSFAVDIFEAGLFGSHKCIFFFESYSGEMLYDPEALEKSMVRIEVNADSLICRDPSIKPPKRREMLDVLKKEVLSVSQYPTIRFLSTKVERSEGNRYTVQGNLEFRGGTKPLTLEATVIRLGADRLEIDGSGTVSLSAYGLKPPASPFKRAKDGILLRLLLWPERSVAKQAGKH